MGIQRISVLFQTEVRRRAHIKAWDESVATIQSATMWVVNKDFDEDPLYKMLSIVYAEAGLKYLATVHQAATEMRSVENAVIGAIILMHKVLSLQILAGERA